MLMTFRHALGNLYNPQLLVEFYLNNWRFYLFLANLYFPQLTSLLVIRKIFKQINLYTISIPGITTMSIDKMPTWLVFKKYMLCWHQNLQKFSMQTDYHQEWKDKI